MKIENTRRIRKKCSKLTVKAFERHQRRHSGALKYCYSAFMIEFEHGQPAPLALSQPLFICPNPTKKKVKQ